MCVCGLSVGGVVGAVGLRGRSVGAGPGRSSPPAGARSAVNRHGRVVAGRRAGRPGTGDPRRGRQRGRAGGHGQRTGGDRRMRRRPSHAGQGLSSRIRLID